MNGKRTILIFFAIMLFAATVCMFYAYTTKMRESHVRLEGLNNVHVTSAGPIEYAKAENGPALFTIYGSGVASIRVWSSAVVLHSACAPQVHVSSMNTRRCGSIRA